MQIRVSEQAAKTIESLDSATKRRLRAGMEGLTEVPPKGDIKAMQGLKGIYRLRVGGYRVIYWYDGQTLVIDKIGSRGDIYK